MKATFYNSYKKLARNTLAASFCLALFAPAAFAQEKPAPAQDIELQKVDGPRKTGRTRASEAGKVPDHAKKQLNIQRGEGSRPQLQGQSNNAKSNADLVKTQGESHIRRLDPDKVQELRQRIRTDRSGNIRNRKFYDERSKNVRRLVQIERIRQLAEESQNENLLKRANELRDKEIERHTRKLASLRTEDALQRRNTIRPNLQKIENAPQNPNAKQAQ